MKQNHFESFAGNFAGLGEGGDFAFGELIEIGKHAGDAIVTVENVGDQSVGGDGFGLFGADFNFHDSLS